MSGTVAHWTFEEGTANTHVPYGPATAGQYAGTILDQSGSGNHLSVWGANWHWYRPLVPAATIPQTGAANTLSIQNANNFPAISAIGTSLTTWSPTAWTLEAAIRPNDATNGFQTFIGRDSRGAHPGNPALAALYFAITPEGGLRILFVDAAGHSWNVTSPANTMHDGKWHAVAATSDGSTLSLYRKNLTDGAADYTLLGTVDISSSANPSLTTGAGDGADWDAGVITVARGLYNGGHTDRFFGHIDDVRLTEGALAPGAFLYSEPPVVADNPAEAWRMAHFGTAENSGSAADVADADGDGVVNLLERAFGGDPNVAENDLLPAIDASEPLLSIVYRKDASATDLEFTVQEASDLASSWTPAAGTESVIAEDGGVQTIRFTRPAGSDEMLFLRLRITAP